MKISVTQDHIDHGLRGSCTNDPVALALRDAGFIRPYIGMNEIRIDGRNGGFMRQMTETPSEVCDFMHEFDQGKPTHPFTFELEF